MTGPLLGSSPMYVFLCWAALLRHSWWRGCQLQSTGSRTPGNSHLEADVSLFSVITHQPFCTCLGWWCMQVSVQLADKLTFRTKKACLGSPFRIKKKYCYHHTRFSQSFLSLCLTWFGSVHSCSLLFVFIHFSTIFQALGYVLGIELCTKLTMPVHIELGLLRKQAFIKQSHK